MTPVQAAILGLVEGVTEYLPISSTGHLIIVSSLLGLGETSDAKRSVDAFTIIIQGGAILAVIGLYWPRFAQMLRGVAGRSSTGLRLMRNLLIAFLPAAIVGVLIADWVERHLFYPRPVMVALALGGIVMIFIARWQRRFFHGDEHADPADAHSFVDIEHLTWRRALLIGTLQCLALWPGVSRSMVTIVGGMAAGLRPRQAAEFSFLLGVPTLGGACVYSTLKNLSGDQPNVFAVLDPLSVAIGILVAALSAAVAIRWLVAYLNHHGLALFGWYRIVLCIVLLLLLRQGMITIEPAATSTEPPVLPQPE